MLLRTLAAAAVAGVLSLPALAQPVFEGWLCCNLRTDGSWLSDSNYAESGKRVVPVGTPVRVTGYGRYRVHVELEGKKQAIGNDYSRDLDLGAFAQRWVVTQDPAGKIAGFPPRIRQAIQQARVTKGMTREQAAMAVGWPISSENPDLNAPLWRMWIGSFAGFDVHFDRNGRVRDIDVDPQTRARVVLE